MVAILLTFGLAPEERKKSVGIHVATSAPAKDQLQLD